MYCNVYMEHKHIKTYINWNVDSSKTVFFQTFFELLQTFLNFFELFRAASNFFELFQTHHRLIAIFFCALLPHKFIKV